MKALVSASLLTLLSVYSNIARSYPSTAAKGYAHGCASCHVAAQGGTVLTDYGRALASSFMSTWSIEHEARELITTRSETVDFGADYRHLFLAPTNDDDGVDQFLMVADIDVAVHRGPFTFMGSFGVYGRDLVPESRESWVQYRPWNTTTIRAGYFMPAYGINTNDHTLSIKRNEGLGRGSETYNIEAWNKNKWFQTFYTVSSKVFRFENDDKYNTYRLGTPEDSVSHRLRFSYVGFKKWELGLNYNLDPFQDGYGFFVVGTLIKRNYLLYEHNFRGEQQSIYTRSGYFLFKGLDAFVEFDRTTNPNFELSNIYIGLDWMVRPRIFLSVKVNMSEGFNQYQSHMWY